ncbi:hypothetical protein CDO87_03395 [Sagittula sp. P11]|uniref:hypothetical protein n=1 Tax=Sagittula sp. P11 TaxID=2009329 RepID=UPI000C2D1C01|nr:hypothetical protein [Sagittula sp. P11]AUC52290.1 hypothetical protein CDO87_03395 [Sagittula sp. P11]
MNQTTGTNDSFEAPPLRLPPLEAQTPDWGDVFQAGLLSERIESDSNLRLEHMERDYLADLQDSLGTAYGPGPEETRSRSTTAQFNNRVDYIVARGAELRENDADGRYEHLPASREEFFQTIGDRARAEWEDAQLVLDGGGMSAELLGRIWGATTDNTSLVTMMLPFGAFSRTGQLGKIALAEGVAGGLGEALTLPQRYRASERLDLEEPNPFLSITMGAAGGAALGTALPAAARVLRYGKIKADSIGARRPADVDQLSCGEAVDEAADDLVGRRSIRPAPYGTMTPEVRAGIFAGESRGDYDALFNFSNRPGGKFSNVRLTEMTVDEAIEFSKPTGPYAQWVKSQIDRVATPMGGYQIVGKTLRLVKKGLRLRGDEKMTPELQERMGEWILRNQGTGAWEGYKGPRRPGTEGAPPDAAPATRAAARPYTTQRGYTSTGTITVGDDFRVDVDYVVTDLRSLRQATGDLQPRDRSRAASDEQVSRIAAGLDPARLMPAPEADRGTPVVGPDNMIESGNGRVMGIARAYERHPDRAQAYRQQIIAAGYEIPEGVDQPVLIARRTSDLTAEQRRDFVRQANTSTIARMSATERAAVDAQAITADVLSLLEPGQPMSAVANAPFVRAAMSGIPQAERSGLTDGSGGLNAEGVLRLRQAVFASAYEAPDILAEFAEADGGGHLKSLVQALEQVAPEWAGMRAAARDGRMAAEFDITGHLLEAVRTIATARRMAAAGDGKLPVLVRELLDDTDLLDGAMAPLSAALVRKFFPGERVAPAGQVADFLRRYAVEARKVGTPDAGLFGDGPTPADALRAIDGETFAGLEDLGAPRGPEPAPQPLEVEPQAIGPYPDGAASPAAEAVDDAIEEALQAPDLADVMDLGVELDGRTWKVSEILAELDADDALDVTVSACAARGVA